MTRISGLYPWLGSVAQITSCCVSDSERPSQRGACAAQLSGLLRALPRRVGGAISLSLSLSLSPSLSILTSLSLSLSLSFYLSLSISLSLSLSLSIPLSHYISLSLPPSLEGGDTSPATAGEHTRISDSVAHITAAGRRGSLGPEEGERQQINQPPPMRPTAIRQPLATRSGRRFGRSGPFAATRISGSDQWLGIFPDQ